jgi:glyoxylase-like metal-dependent hydrolase (beta-lactamase superfamily II)
MNESPAYDVFAIKYAERDARRSDHFIGGDPHDAPMSMDYFVWAIVGNGQTWVVDTGFGPDDAARRKRRLVRSTADGLSLIGIDAATTTNVILTHLHYDHVGGFDQFPNTRFHLQDREMAFATGRNMTTHEQSHSFTPRHIAEMVMAVHDGRVAFHDGDSQLADGLSVHLLGGHTDGLQVVRVNTRLGWLVLASDATHYYENMDTTRPFPIVFNLDAMVAGYDRLRILAGPDGVIVPGHDPKVFDRHPAADASLEGIVARLS